MNDLFLSDEDILGKEPSLEEQSLMQENNKLKIKLINTEEDLEIAQYAINKINEIIEKAINVNISKTRRLANPAFIKMYREELLTLRAVEKELKDYNNRMVKMLQ